MASYTLVTNYETTLAQGMTASQSSLVVSSVTLQGHALVPADYGDYLYFTINPGAANMEVVRATTNTGTTFTLDKRGLAWYGSAETELASYKFEHNAGEPVIVSNVKNAYEQMVDKLSDETIAGVKTFSSPPVIPSAPSTGTEAANKNYVDLTAISAGGLTYLLVTDAGALTVDVAAGEYISGTNAGYYSGASAQSVTDNATNYVQLRYDGTLSIRTDQFVDGYIPLAIVVAASGDITSVTDRRPFFSQPNDSQLVFTTGVYGASLVYGDPVYVDAADSNKFKKALATSAATADGFLGICIESGGDGDTPKRVLVGGMWGAATGLTPNAPVYLTDAGGFANAAGTYKKVVGWAVSATGFLLMPNMTVDKLPGTNSDVTTANINEAATFFGNTAFTAGNANTLIGGSTSNADTLHTHPKLLTPFSLVAPDVEDANTTGGICATGFSDVASPILVVGSFGTNTGVAVFPYMPVTLVPFFDILAAQNNPTSGGVLRIGTDYWRSEAATIYKGGSTVTISGTAPSGDSALGYDSVNSYLLVQDANNTVKRYSGIAGTTITYVDAITLDNAVNTGKGFIFDNTNSRYVFIDGATIRRFDSAGTTIDTVSIGDGPGGLIGLCFINDRVWAVTMNITTDSAGGTTTDSEYTVQFIPTGMTR